MKALSFSGELPPQFDRLIAELGPLLGFVSAAGGTPVEVFRADGVVVEKRGQSIRLGWGKVVHLCRALSLLSAAWDRDLYTRAEHPCFETCVMFDASRNACPRPDTLRLFLRRMALMGIDAGMLYTEDTYEVPGEAYIGYMRGRYSMEELRGLDDFAAIFGIELIPCIQTLGHLNRVLHWPAMAHYADNDEVILTDYEETYTLLRRMISAASAPYRSRRIHIGMDEADGIGLGEHLRIHGYENPHQIIQRHLLRVKEITDDLGLKPMIWSDMYFRLNSPHNAYYEAETWPAEENVVPDVDLVYWDYYHQKEDEYALMLEKHQRLCEKPLFAGGLWTWMGPAPDFDKTLVAGIPALTACKKAGVPFVIATAWSDDGAETNLMTALPGMQFYAEFAYTGAYDAEWMAGRFAACCGADIQPFTGLSRFNRTPGMKSRALMPVNAAKFLLYQDPLVQLFAKDTEGLPMAKHYEGLAHEYETYAGAGGDYAGLMSFYAKLARVLAGKCRWHEGIIQAVTENDKDRARRLAETLTKTSEDTEALRVAWRKLWLSTNKPYGFEIIDGRMGALRARLETAQSRVLTWVRGEEDETLPELHEKSLPYTLREGGELSGAYQVSDIVSACRR